jgi:hypothetical protein
MNQVSAAMVIARIESVLTRKTRTLEEANH